MRAVVTEPPAFHGGKGKGREVENGVFEMDYVISVRYVRYGGQGKDVGSTFDFTTTYLPQRGHRNSAGWLAALIFWLIDI